MLVNENTDNEDHLIDLTMFGLKTQKIT